MIIRSKFHIFAFFMTVLFTSTPFLSIAAQITKEAENNATTEQKSKADYAELIKTAKADAKSDLDDTQRILWFLGGVGCGICTVGAAAVMNPNPPIHRLLGKSPEYVAIYANTYTKQMRTSRLRLASAGCLVNTVLYGIMILNDSSSYSGSGSGCTSSDFELFSSSSSGCN